MSRKQVCFSPDVNDKPTILLKNGSRARESAGKRKLIAGIFCFRLPRSTEFLPTSLLSRLGAKVAGVLRSVTNRRKSSRKVSSATLVRSRSLADAIDSQRAQAIEDCIEFLNSSSSLQRSNSVSTQS